MSHGVNRLVAPDLRERIEALPGCHHEGGTHVRREDVLAALPPDRDSGLRAAVEWAISALEHTSDRHATDALLKLRAALASDGETT